MSLAGRRRTEPVPLHVPGDCRWCGDRLAPDSRADRLYCDSTCRSEFSRWKALQGGRIFTKGGKALKGAARSSRRPTREGLGTRIYVTPQEAADWAEGVVAGSLREKLDAGARRLGGAA